MAKFPRFSAWGIFLKWWMHKPLLALLRNGLPRNLPERVGSDRIAQFPPQRLNPDGTFWPTKQLRWNLDSTGLYHGLARLRTLARGLPSRTGSCSVTGCRRTFQ